MRIIDIDKWQEIFLTLKKNKLRTFFTAFGVFWGIFMLVVMLGSGKGLKDAAYGGLGKLATNSVFMNPSRTSISYKGFPKGRTFAFNNDDTQAIKDRIPQVKFLAPIAEGFGMGANNVVRGERVGGFRVSGDYPETNMINPMELIHGRFLNYFDIEENRKVAVIGWQVYEEMFDEDEDPIGQTLRVNGVYFTVVGVFKSYRASNQGGEGDNQRINLPFTTVQKAYNLGNAVQGGYAITSIDGVPASVVEQKVLKILKERHSIHPDDNRAIESFNLEKEFNDFETLFNGINGLIWIVGIGTLLAGVIGVSNIMVIVVKERTKEFGIKRAVGATPMKIIMQVIQESVFLTTLAGYIGLSLGVGLLELISYAMTQSGADTEMFSNPSVDFEKAITALILLVISGIFAGFIPAKRAVSIKPIAALHDE